MMIIYTSQSVHNKKGTEYGSFFPSKNEKSTPQRPHKRRGFQILEKGKKKVK